MKNNVSARLFLLLLCLSIGITSANAQIISTYAGNGTVGYSGDGGVDTAANLYGPYGIVADTNGNIYFSEARNHVIRKVTPGGIISTIAGDDTAGYIGDGGPATAAKLHSPRSMGIDGYGNIYFEDSGNNVVRMIATNDTIYTVVGTGAYGYSGDGGAAHFATLRHPSIAVDIAGDIFIADANNYRIRMVNTSRIISTIGGTGVSGDTGDGGPATAATMNPKNIGVDWSGNIYYTDSISPVYRVVRKISAADQNISLYLNIWAQSFAFNGDNDLYFSDLSCYIRRVGPFGYTGIYAGDASCSYSGDGDTATKASLNTPVGITFDANRNLYIAEYKGQRIRVETYDPSLGSTGVKNIATNNDLIKVYPNPASGSLTIEMPDANGSAAISISDMAGRVIDSRSVQAGSAGIKEQFDVSKFPVGIYLVKVSSGNNTYREKVVVR